MSQFKVGDTVRLKSGGPLMTVEKIGTNAANEPTVWCVWFHNDKRERDNFRPDSLVADVY